MSAYIIRRLIQLPITVFGVTVLIFLMMMTLDPVERSALYIRDVPHTEGALDAVIRRYGLDDPFHVQYWRWLVGTTDLETGERVGGILRDVQVQPDLGRRRGHQGAATSPVAGGLEPLHADGVVRTLPHDGLRLERESELLHEFRLHDPRRKTPVGVVQILVPVDRERPGDDHCAHGDEPHEESARLHALYTRS